MFCSRLLSGRASLPSVSEMHAAITAFHKQLEEEGIAPEYTHRMAGDIQMQYLDSLVAASGPGVGPIPRWRGEMYRSNGLNKQMHPEDYRDHWENEGVAEAALGDLREVWKRLQQQQEEEEEGEGVAAEGKAGAAGNRAAVAAASS